MFDSRKVECSPPVVADEPTKFAQSGSQLTATTVTFRQTVQFTFDPKKLGLLERNCVSLFFQPVGIDKPNRDVIRCGQNRAHEALVSFQ
jgi:hypothetical protein